MVNYICIICNKEFESSKKKKTCSKQCQSELNHRINPSKKEERICIICGAKFLAKKSNKQKFCTPECYSKSVKGIKRKPFTEEHKRKISESRIGLKIGYKLSVLCKEWWMQKYDMSEKEAKEKVSNLQKENARKNSEKTRGKSFNEIYGKERAVEIKSKLSATQKEKYSNFSEEEKKAFREKDSISLKKFWNSDSEKVDNLKQKFRSARISRNKTQQREFILNLSEEEKLRIKRKKIETFEKRTEEEKEKINKSRVENSMKSMRSKISEIVKLKNGNTVITQSNLEKEFVNECENLNILIENGPVIPYMFNGKIKHYYIDFSIKINENYYLIEIKGRHKWYYEDLKNGKLDKKKEAVLAYLSMNKKYKDFLFLLSKKPQEIKYILEEKIEANKH